MPVKSTAKGVNRVNQIELIHEKYKNVHEGIDKQMRVTSYNLKKEKNQIYLIKCNKIALAKVDTKRYWINNVKSIAYGHPDISNVNSNNVTSSKIACKRKAVNLNDRELLFNKKRASEGRLLYNM